MWNLCFLKVGTGYLGINLKKKMRSKYVSNNLKTLGRKKEGRPFGIILFSHVVSVFAAGEPG